MAKKNTKKKAGKKKAAKKMAAPKHAMMAHAAAAAPDDAGGAFTVPPAGPGGVCPIQPDQDGHGDIDATAMAATHLNEVLRNLASQGFVCLVWQCSSKLWVRPVPPGGTIP